MRDAFYPKENGFLSKEDFTACFTAIGFPISADETSAILADLGCDQQTTNVIELAQFYNKLSCWKDIMDKKQPGMIDNLNRELLTVFKCIGQSIGP